MAQIYLKKRSNGLPKSVEGTDDGELYVNVGAQTPPTTLPLPTGAATSALQTAGNASLASMAASTTCTHDSITLTAANTEYSKAIPANCKKLTFRAVDSTKLNAGSDLRYAWATGKVAAAILPFMLLEGGAVYFESNLLLTSKTLYVAGVTAGDIVLLEMWT